MKKIKIIIDILMFVVTVLLMEIEVIGFLSHEILGMLLGILILIHIVLNFKWIKQVTKNFKSTNTKTKIMYAIDIFTMVIYFGAIICGMLISHEIFNSSLRTNVYMMLAHITFGRLAVIIMFIHLGMHLDRMLAKIKSKSIKRTIYILYIIISLSVAIYSIYALTNSFQWIYVFGM